MRTKLTKGSLPAWMRAALLAAYALCLVGMLQACDDKDQDKVDPKHKVVKAPEVGKDGMGAALGLLVGSILVIIGRKK